MIIGITGGIASGKTEVSNFLAEFGAEIIDADKIAREVVKHGKRAYFEIIKEFGENILLENGEIDRKKLGLIVFSDAEKRKKLENITHPEIMQEIAEKIQNSKLGIIFLVVPLLIEKNMQDMVDYIWLVKTKKENQIKRLIKRDGLTEREAQKRIKTQLPYKYKEKFADIVIKNDGTLSELKENVRKLYQKLLKERDALYGQKN